MDDIALALLGDHEAAQRMTERGELIPCPGCKDHFSVAIRCTETKAEIVCQNRECGFRIAKNCKDGSAFALLKAKRAWNTRAPVLSPTQMAVLERMEATHEK